MLDELRTSGAALITGATTGIGRALADGLAERGFDLIIVGPPWEDASAVAGELERTHPVSVQAWQHDLANQKDVQALAQRLDDRPISVVCANAGIGRFGPYWTHDNVAQAQVNVVGTCAVLDAVLPGMIARGSGAVLLTGSTGGVAPLPGAATYGATKAFIGALGRALRIELAPHGISTTVLQSGPVRTEFPQRARAQRTADRVPDLLWVDADEAARAALEAVEHGRLNAYPGWQGWLFRGLAGLPNAVAERALALVMDVVGPGASRVRSDVSG